jgi:glycosyltransferase involved in cell wall biosynthesis
VGEREDILNKRYFYISNAFEETVLRERAISGDSPAASGKVIRVCRAVRSAGGKTYVVSLGRGRQKGTWKLFPPIIRRSGSAPVIYTAFYDAPLFTHIVSMLSLCVIMIKLTNRYSTIIYYNYLPHYIPTLLVNYVLGRNSILDIEDGYIQDDKSFKGLINKLLLKTFNRLCTGGAMLASSALKFQASLSRNYVCYGVAPCVSIDKDWSEDRLQILFGGSLLKDTGAVILLEAIELIQLHHSDLASKFKFIITGFGDYSAELEKVALTYPNLVDYYGNVDADAYRALLRRSHIGLCLKIPDLSMGATTFPSKVIELTAYGLLLISTRVSDVPKVFSTEMALLLDDVSATGLVEALTRIYEDPQYYYQMSLRCKKMISQLYTSEKVGSELLRFWEGKDAGA